MSAAIQPDLNKIDAVLKLVAWRLKENGAKIMSEIPKGVGRQVR